MARTEGSRSRTTIEFQAAWDIATKAGRFDLIKKLLRWCKSRDPDVSLRAIALAMTYRYSKPATLIDVDAPAQMVLGWVDDELVKPEDHEQPSTRH